MSLGLNELTQAESHMYASLDYAIIGSDNGVAPVRHQTIIWTNADVLSIGP